LLLASQSPRRRELLALLGLPFEVTVADVAEDPLANESPAATVVRLSQAKARAACPEQSRRARAERCAELVEGRSRGTAVCTDALIIACDTIVALDGELLGKPRDAAEALSVLRRLRGRSHAVFSAVTLLEPAAGRTSSDVAETRLVMRTYSDAEMAAYVASDDPLDKAGAYAIQHPGFHPVADLQGCYANVMGLPLCHLTRGLRAWNIEPPHDVPAACQAHTGRRCPVHATILAGRPNR
jgi:MAF protein